MSMDSTNNTPEQREAVLHGLLESGNREVGREAFEQFASLNGVEDFERAMRGEGHYLSIHLEELWQYWQAAMAHKEASAWQPIETAPRDKTVLLGYRNSHGHWRTLRGEWFSLEEIYDHWEDPEGVDAGWFEMSVEADDVPNVWRTNPTHWMPLPAAPLNTTTKPA